MTIKSKFPVMVSAMPKPKKVMILSKGDLMKTSDANQYQPPKEEKKGS